MELSSFIKCSVFCEYGSAEVSNQTLVVLVLDELPAEPACLVQALR